MKCVTMATEYMKVELFSILMMAVICVYVVMAMWAVLALHVQTQVRAIVPKMLFAFYVCCIYSAAHQTRFCHGSKQY